MVAAKTLDHHYDIDRLIFGRAQCAATAQLNAKAIQNLNVRLSYPSTEQVASQHTWGLALKGAVLTIILLAAGLALVAGMWLKQVLFFSICSTPVRVVFAITKCEPFYPQYLASPQPFEWPFISAVVIIVVITGAGFIGYCCAI